MIKNLSGALFLCAFGIFCFNGFACAAVYLLPPEEGVYHSAHPDFGLRDDAPDADKINGFSRLAGKKIVWGYVSFHWDRGIKFPAEACRILRGEGVIPLVGIMPWSGLKQGSPEPLYTLGRIARGDFDSELQRCAQDAKSLGFPIMIEFGPEANGSWFPWNGAWNGAGEDFYGEKGFPDGPERFRDAYRRVVRIFRDAGADDVTWVFHVASDGAPKKDWNSASYYYPGDEFVDWIGASLYGRLRGGDPARAFDDIMGKVYPGLCALSPSKPIAILELGVSDPKGTDDKPEWIREAFSAVSSGRYPRLKAVSWWNKVFRPDGKRSTLEIDSSPESLEAYRDGVLNLEDEARWGAR
jgi:hypothetical protein